MKRPELTDEEFDRLVAGWAWTADYWRSPDATDREIARKLGGHFDDLGQVHLPDDE